MLLAQLQKNLFPSGTTCTGTTLVSLDAMPLGTKSLMILRSIVKIQKNEGTVLHFLPHLQAYLPGDFPTHWALKYSEDKCFVRYPGKITLDMAYKFCKRMGGRVPGKFALLPYSF